MFDPNHAGISGEFCCVNNALFIPQHYTRYARDIVPTMQALATAENCDFHFPYILGRQNNETCICVPSEKEYAKISNVLKKYGLPEVSVAGAYTAFSKTERDTSLTGLMFSNSYLIYSHLCTMSLSYYGWCQSPVKDEYYDQLWRAFDYRNKQDPESVKKHPHYNLLQYADIESGSFHRVPKWPIWIQNAANIYLTGVKRYIK